MAKYKINYKAQDSKESELEIIKAFETLGYVSDGWDPGAQIELKKPELMKMDKANCSMIFLYPKRKECEKAGTTYTEYDDGESGMSYGEWRPFTKDELQLLDKLGYVFVKGYGNKFDMAMEDWF